MDGQTLRNLQEAYMEVVENQQLDELSVNRMIAYTKKAEKNRDELNKKWDKGTATPKERKKVFDREEGEARAERKIKQKTGKNSHQMNALDRLKAAVKKEQVDIYDIILSHLLDEGYAETPEAAEVIMVNMSEEWVEDIMERMDPEERAMRRELAADKRASKMDAKVGAKYAGSEAQSAAKADKKSKGKHIHGTVDESSHLETDPKKRQKNNEKAVEDMKKTKGYADMVKAARKHFDEETISERELDPTETSEKERLVKGMKKSAADFKARYGKRWKNVMYATATKQAKDGMDTSKSDRRYGVER